MRLKLLAPLVLLSLLLSVFLDSGVFAGSSPSLLKTWQYGSSDTANDVAVDSSGNITIAGDVDGSALLLRYNSTGSLLLQRLWRGPNAQSSTGGAADASGNAYVIGSTNSLGDGLYHLFLVKFDSDGNVGWQEAYTGRSFGGGVTVAPGGDVVVSGNGTLFRFNSFGSLVWQDAWIGKAPQLFFGRVVEDAFGDIYTISLSSVLKFNSLGGLLWARSWSGMSDGLFLIPPFHPDISVDASGNVYLVGVGPVNTQIDSIYLLKLSPDGNLLWQRRWETFDATMLHEGVAANASNIIYVTAAMSICQGPRVCASPYEETLILEFNSTGSLIGRLGIQEGGDVGLGLGRPSIDSKGSLYLTGAGGVAGASLCSPPGSLKTSAVSLTSPAGSLVALSNRVVPLSGSVSAPAGNETSQSGVLLLKFDPPFSGVSAACSSVGVFPQTLPIVTLIGIMISILARKRLSCPQAIGFD